MDRAETNLNNTKNEIRCAASKDCFDKSSFEIEANKIFDFGFTKNSEYVLIKDTDKRINFLL